SPCLGLVGDVEPHPMPPQPLPEPGHPLRDPAFGATLVRVATASLGPDRRQWEPGTLSWSPDERWFLRRTSEPGHVALHDATTYEEIERLRLGAPRWSHERPGVLYDVDVDRGTVRRLDVARGEVTQTLRLGACSDHAGGWRVSDALSWRGDRLGLQCGGLGWFVSLPSPVRSREVTLDAMLHPA